MTAWSALAIKGMDEEMAGAALDVFTEQIRRDPGLITFHGGGDNAVKISTGLDIPWEEVPPWSVVTASLGFLDSDERVGGAVEGLRLRAWFIWPEPSFWRLQGEAGIADLDMRMRLAVNGGRDAAGVEVHGNPGLEWRPNVAPYSWPDAPPAGFPVAIGVQTTTNGVLDGPLPSVHGSGEVELSGMESCIVSALAIDTVFGVTRSKC